MSVVNNVPRIHVNSLRTGMTVYRQTGRNTFEPEFVLKSFFRTSPKFPYLAWETSLDTKVLYHPCGSVFAE